MNAKIKTLYYIFFVPAHKGFKHWTRECHNFYYDILEDEIEEIDVAKKIIKQLRNR